MSDIAAKIDRLQTLLQEACAVGDAELAHDTLEQLLDLHAKTNIEEVAEEPEKIPVWNNSPEWALYCQTILEPQVKKIANKYTSDEALREDCENEAREAIYQIFPENVNDYDKYKAGLIDETAWAKKVKKYCCNAIRNSVLSYLDSPKKGPWYIGRTKRVRDKATGKRIKEHKPPRYSSLEQLMEESGLQVDESGEITWEATNVDGLPENRAYSPKSHHVSRSVNLYSEE